MAVAGTAELSRYGRTVGSVFELLGVLETDLTAAFGFTLSRSPLLRSWLATTCGLGDAFRSSSVRLEFSGEIGRTDVEMVGDGQLVVIEAKRGWSLPTEAQLASHASRVAAVGDGVLISLSGASREWAGFVLPASVADVRLEHLQWSEVRDAARSAASTARGDERRWLRELYNYLRKVTNVKDPSSGWAYCVVLSDTPPEWGGDLTFHQYVTDTDTYFHPFGWGHGWPTEPPNFMAFRHRGKVIRISRVLDADVYPTMAHRYPDIEPVGDAAKPHVVYRLGPSLPMRAPIPSGTNYRAVRLWVLIDQLLVSDTLKQAVEASRTIAAASAP